MTATQPLKNYIRSARKRAGLTQEELAYLLGGRGGKLVSRYELFRRAPMLPAALASQAALGVPAHELFSGVYQSALRTVLRRARVMEIQLRGKPRTLAIERKRQTLRRILELERGESSPERASISSSFTS